MSETIIIAHRGHGPTSLLSGDGGVVPPDIAPENTIKSFKEAVFQGADGIEFDVYVAKDGEIVVIHDDELNKNVEGANREGTDLGLVSKKTLKELRAYNVGQGEHMPTLRETLDFFVEANKRRQEAGKPNLIINVELKGEGTYPGVAKLAREYIDNGLLKVDDFVFCSFFHDQLAAIKRENPDFRIAPNLKTSLLFGKDNLIMPGWHVKESATYDPAGLNQLITFHRDHKCAAFDPVLWDVYRPLLDIAKAEGVELHISTSDLRTFERQHLIILLALERSGVKLHFKTDEPARAREVLNQLRTTFDKGVSTDVHATVAMETIDTLEGPYVTHRYTPFAAAARENTDPLERPISNRPSPFSKAYFANAMTATARFAPPVVAG